VSGFFGSVDLSKTGRSVLLDFGSWCLINVYVPNAGHRVRRGGRRGGGKAASSSSGAARSIPSSASRGGPAASGVSRPEDAEPVGNEAPVDVVLDGDEAAEGEGLEGDEEDDEAGIACGSAIPGQEHRPTLPIKMAFLAALRRKGERYGSAAHRGAAMRFGRALNCCLRLFGSLHFSRKCARRPFITIRVDSPLSFLCVPAPCAACSRGPGAVGQGGGAGRRLQYRARARGRGVGLPQRAAPHLQCGGACFHGVADRAAGVQPGGGGATR
jgi:hypothetical protein